MWAGIWGLFAVLPQIFELGKLVWKAIADGVDYLDVRIHLKKFDAAAEQAQQTGDTSKLEELFRGKK